jgi:putative oxidoreductase
MLNGILPQSWSGPIHAALRIMTGLLFLQHGTAKILKFPAVDMFKDGVSGIFLVSGILELVGGILIILGLFTRTTAFILSGFMAVAYFMVHAPGGFFPIINQGELAILYCFVFLYLATAGAGPFSLDAGRRQA